jgi:hypothetical protein
MSAQDYGLQRAALHEIRHPVFGPQNPQKSTAQATRGVANTREQPLTAD